MMPEEIWADVVRHEKDPYWDFNGSKGEFNGGTKYLRSNLCTPSTPCKMMGEEEIEEYIYAKTKRFIDEDVIRALKSAGVLCVKEGP